MPHPGRPMITGTWSRFGIPVPSAVWARFTEAPVTPRVWERSVERPRPEAHSIMPGGLAAAVQTLVGSTPLPTRARSRRSASQEIWMATSASVLSDRMLAFFSYTGLPRLTGGPWASVRR
jgi:hypothetical protein